MTLASGVSDVFAQTPGIESDVVASTPGIISDDYEGRQDPSFELQHVSGGQKKMIDAMGLHDVLDILDDLRRPQFHKHQLRTVTS